MAASIFIDELFAAGEVAFIMAIGAMLEDCTAARAKKGINELMKLTPQQGRRIVTADGVTTEETVPAEDIRKDDLLRVFPGESIPADGVIVFGDTSVDQSVMTGESLPADKKEGDEVFCGTINRFGSIDIRVTKAGEDSSLQKMIRMVKEAENKKAPMQRIVDKWATWLVPVALLIAVATWLITSDIVRAVTVLVVFCPCALALATPTSIMAAIGQATKHGVLIKSGEALEIMGKVDCIAFDKTGTLTFGKLEVSNIIPFAPSISPNELLQLAASAELRSEHPLGKAVVSHAKSTGSIMTEPSDFRMIPGKGITAVIDGKTTVCGSSSFLNENGISLNPESQTALDKLRSEGKASVLVAADRLCLGVIALSDAIRPAAKEMVGKLEQMNTEVVLLTGDNRQAASFLASQAGISIVYAELLPAEKVAGIESLQQSGKKVCMIGDGVNDAPALKTADVSIAMGGMGSDIAIEAADIALTGDDVSKIPYLKILSNTTLSNIRLNITLSMSLNFAAIILSVLAVLNPVTGALVHNAGSVLVVLNAVRLYDRKFKY
jgi:heavy metal translocating P-type ATPase